MSVEKIQKVQFKGLEFWATWRRLNLSKPKSERKQ